MSEEHQIAIVSFEGAIKREIKRVRERLKPAAEQGTLKSNEFRFTIEGRGRILDGEVKLSYKICDNHYGSNEIEARGVDPLVDELLRRSGWKAVNAPLEIAFDKTREDEIPF